MKDHAAWWRSAVIYQVYLRSFADGNGDGTGDIAGLLSRLPYLQSLGVDALWINPWYVSPLRDGGYDVADYRDIDPRYGSLEEATRLFQRARELGLRVLVDLVPNHTSSEHAWFREALAAPAGSEARSRYHFRDGKGEGGSEPPTNWTSMFGGSAWTRVEDGQWYLHLFDSSQPDLNWENEEVRSEFDDILRFWLERGASGFRVDVAHGLAKEPNFSDIDGNTDIASGNHPCWDRDAVHPIIERWRKVLDEYPGSMMVAEAWAANWGRLSRYLRPGEYHQAFNFEFLNTPFQARWMRGTIERAIAGAGSVDSLPTWVLSNHDVMRHATRFGLKGGGDGKAWLLTGDSSKLDAQRGLERARAAALLMLALPGSAYIYQGEELGLPEVWDLPEEVLDDPVWRRSGGKEKGRDGCRVPIPWSDSGPSFGFGQGPPWLRQPRDWGQFAVSLQEGQPGSMLELYRRALALRSECFQGNGRLTWLELGDDVLAFRRGNAVCVVNIGAEPVPVPDGEVLLTSTPLTEGLLPADAAAWLRAG